MFLVVIFTLLLGYFLEWTVGPALSFWGVTPPLASVILIFWFWQFSLLERIVGAALAGIFADSLSVYPAGTYVALFMVLAFLTEALRRLFSDSESMLVKSISTSVLIFALFNLFYPLVSALGFYGRYAFSPPRSWFTVLFFSSIFWIVITEVFFFLLQTFLARVKRRPHGI